MAVQNSLSSAFVRLNEGEGCAFALQAVRYFISMREHGALIEPLVLSHANGR